MNYEEAKLICGNNPKKNIIKELQKLGCENVVITDGKEKISVLYENNYFEHVPKKIKPKETTGAGDAFGATLVAGLILGKDIKFSVDMALKNSGSVIRKIGAKEGLLTKKELLK